MLSGSLELGCFLAGVVISSRGPSETEQVRHYIDMYIQLLGILHTAAYICLGSCKRVV